MGKIDMTQDEIKELAHNAGFSIANGIVTGGITDLKRFAKLVADVATAKEREACAKVCGDLMFGANPYERWEGMKWCMDRIKARGEA
jgi:hypothetical protein